eukprot:Lankesteria_metandrocarpae@DN3896_c1_g1_i1.p1
MIASAVETLPNTSTRILSVLQGKTSNYDTDLFVPIFEATRQAIPNLEPYTGKVGEAEDKDKKDMAYRVVADHIRTLTVAIADGAYPSNEGRGYVLRRVLRRALRYGQQFLGAPKDEIWFGNLVPVVIDTLGRAFPELLSREDIVKTTIVAEEEQFGRTLDRGVNLFNKLINVHLKYPEAKSKVLSGTDVFDLYATFGFPVDLTEIMADERGFTIDFEGFQKAFDNHRKASESQSTVNHLAALSTLKPDLLHELESTGNLPATEDRSKYDWSPKEAQGCTVKSRVCAMWNGNTFVDKASAGEYISILVDITNFYAEAGGQVGDVGYAIITPSTATGGTATGNSEEIKEAEFTIEDTRRFAKYVLHIGRVREGSVQVGDAAALHVDYLKRSRTAKNHTGTHILNHALRKVLGADCDQKGSLVEPSRLRFDFSNNKAMLDAEIKHTQEIVRSIIKANKTVHAEELPYARAKAIDGLRAVFGEVYPDPIRVVSVGPSVDNILIATGEPLALQTSVEFCGGTHCHDTGTINDFVVISEESVARGIRRMVAVTGTDASDSIKFGEEVKNSFEGAKSLQGVDLQTAVGYLSALLRDKKEVLPYETRKDCAAVLEMLHARRIEEGKKRQKALQAEAQIIGEQLATEIDGSRTKFVVKHLDNLEGEFKPMETFVTAFHKKLKIPVLVVSQGSAGLFVFSVVPPTAETNLEAAEWVSSALASTGEPYKSGGKVATARGSIVGLTSKGAAKEATEEAKRFANTFFP